MTVLAALFGAALAAGPLAATTAPAPRPGGPVEVLPSEARSGAFERDPEIEAIGRELRCPVCQGMPIGESPSEMAQAMMKRVRELHAEGKSHDEIRAYFVQRYGEWVLLKPEAQGFNLLVWVMPPAMLVAGLLAVVLYVQRTRKKPVPAASAPAGASDDPYVRQVRERLEKGDA